ncbi:hypothetical protein FDUTEX481_09143 [Tolypothrix sp. PCC 7601]|nr:hypothetical protein FDUTEX481_09143 [Tolypothrix sp. PCC 7601]
MIVKANRNSTALGNSSVSIPLRGDAIVKVMAALGEIRTLSSFHPLSGLGDCKDICAKMTIWKAGFPSPCGAR